MDELSTHLKQDAEFRIKLAGGSPDESSTGSGKVDPGDMDADDIVGAGFGVKVDKD